MKIAAVILAVALGVLLLTGCHSLTAPGENQNLDQLPWNTPASWENSIIGVPY